MDNMYVCWAPNTDWYQILWGNGHSLVLIYKCQTICYCLARPPENFKGKIVIQAV